MKKFSKLNEKISEEIEKNLSDEYKALKTSVLELIQESVEDDKLITIQNFLEEYLTAQNESGILKGFTENVEIFDFYLKHQIDVDEVLNSKNFFTESPESKNVFSLYDYVIEGTKQCVKHIVKILQNEIFE